MVELDNYINRVKQLPPAPQLLPELLDILNKPNLDSNRVVRLIAYDPSLTANVLQACNSASSAPQEPIIDLDSAVLRLGFQEIYRLVASILGAELLCPRTQSHVRDAAQLWQHSVATAVAAQLIAREVDDDPHLAFTAALLHDLGKIVLSEACQESYARLIEEVESNQFSLLEAEKRILGVQHSEVGGRLLTRWKFPLNLVTAVWFHAHPAAAQSNGQRVAAIVYLGNLVAYLIGYGYGHHAVTLRGRGDVLDILKLEPDALPRFMMMTWAEVGAIQRLFKVGRTA
jgi:putative nucleotidyltransferase with HDIG domain